MTTALAFPTLNHIQQGWKYQALHDFNGRRLRVTIYRDSYDNQSSAKVEAWTDSGWTEVVSKPGTSIDFLPGAYSLRKPVPSGKEDEVRDAAENLAGALLAQAKFVLGA